MPKQFPKAPVRSANPIKSKWAISVKKQTLFGIEIIGGRGVRSTDIALLPFAEFWYDSAVKSSQTHDKLTFQWLVRLSDWWEFSELFIATGRHRNIPRSPEVLWFD